MYKRRWQEDTGKYAVVTDDSFYYIRQGSLVVTSHQGIKNARQLFQCLKTLNLIYAWVLPGSKLSRQTETFYTSCTEYECLAYAEIDREVDENFHVIGEGDMVLHSLQGWEKSAHWKECYYVVFPEYNSSWQPDSDAYGLDECTNPIELHTAISYIEDQLGVPLKQSPGNAGLELLRREVHPRAMLPTCPSNFARNVTYSQNAIWGRPLTARELACRYIHCVDKNSAYLAACKDVFMGVGLPFLVNNPCFTEEYVNVPGVWYVRKIEGTSLFDGKHLPIVATANTWVWTPTLALLHSLGYTVEIEKAYLWRDYDRVLSTWATHIWDSRHSLKNNLPGYKNEGAREKAYNAMKVIATRTVGKFKSEYSIPGYKNGGTDYHPDRWALVLDKTRVRMLLRMLELYRNGYPPFMVYTDGLYIASNERYPHAHNALALDTCNELGGYKHAYTVRMEDVKEALSLDMPLMIRTFKDASLLEGER